jgi:hypothetical protein
MAASAFLASATSGTLLPSWEITLCAFTLAFAASQPLTRAACDKFVSGITEILRAVDRNFQPRLFGRARLFSAMDTLDGDKRRGVLMIE